MRLSQGSALVIKYQRVASAPYSASVLNGSAALPRRLDILLPFLSKTKPVETTFLKATESNSIPAMACSVKNQPRVWSTPSLMKSAGKLSLKIS